MAMVFKTRHFKRTLFVAAVIGGMWYMYVTKNNNSGSKEADTRDAERPLSLQERMQEVLAAREWLAENSVKLGGYNGPGRGGAGGGREEDTYSPNLLFNNAPPPPPALRTYYGANPGVGGGGAGAVMPTPDDVAAGRRFQTGWANGAGDPLGLPRPFAGGSGDLNKYLHVGADDPGYADTAQNSGNLGGVGVGVGVGGAGRMPLAAAPPQQGRGEGGQYGAWGQQQAAVAPTWSENAPPGVGSFPPQRPPEDSRKMNPGGAVPGAWNSESYPPQQQSFNAPNVPPDSGSGYPNPNPQHADMMSLKYSAYPQTAIGPSGRPNMNPLATGGDGSAPGHGLNPDTLSPFDRHVVGPGARVGSDVNAVMQDDAERQKAMQMSKDVAGTNWGESGHGDTGASPALSLPERSLEAQDHFPPANKPPLPPASLSLSAGGQAPGETLQKTPSHGSDDNGNPVQQRESVNAAPASGRQGNSPTMLGAAVVPPTTTTPEAKPSFVGRILARLLSTGKDDDTEPKDPGAGPSKGTGAGRDAPGVAEKDAKGSGGSEKAESAPQSLVHSVRTGGDQGQGPDQGHGQAGNQGQAVGGQGRAGVDQGQIVGGQGQVNGPGQTSGQGQIGGQGQAHGQGVPGHGDVSQMGLQPGNLGGLRAPVPARPSSFGLLSSVGRPGGFPQQQPQQQQNPSADIYLMQQRAQPQQQPPPQPVPGAQFPQQPGQQLQVNQNPAVSNSPAASSDDLTKVPMVTRDKTHWKEDECPAKDDSLTQTTLTTPFGNVPLYVDKGVDDTAAFNRAFGVQWNMHGIGTFFDRCVLPDPNVTLVDIGAGLGPVALTAARLGREAFAIEPMDTMVGALCRTVTDFRYNNVRVMHNAVSDERTKVFYRKVGNKNQPTDTYVVDTRNKSKIDPNAPSALAIRLDDMLRLYKVSKVAVRMELQGLEGRALVGANKFFNTLDISCILMDWTMVHSLKEFGGSYVFDMLSGHGFFPHHVQTLKPLKIFRMHEWPTEVLWARLGSAPVKM